MPAMMPSSPSATARTAAASVTIENTISDAAAASRGVAAKRMPALISGSALSRLRLKPVTVWPAAMSRGTMPTPMAPSPTKPRFMQPTSQRFAKRMMAPNARESQPEQQIRTASSPRGGRRSCGQDR
jgi:hypothetical protein